MNKQITNIFFIILICVIAYFVFSYMNLIPSMKEGLENNASSATDGVAGNATTYAANLKAMTIKNQDALLISKYRNDYENAILNLDDLINTMMLQTALNVDKSNPMTSLQKLNELNSARNSLNSVMKFVDSSA